MTQIHFKTPLHYAAQHGFYDIAVLLIRSGAYIDPLGKDNRTPLHVACRDGGSSVLSLLISNGADMYVFFATLTYIKLILRTHQNSNENRHKLDANEDTPFHLACCEGRLDCALRLLCLGARLEKRSIVSDDTNVLKRIERSLNAIRNRQTYRRLKLYSKEEKKWLQKIALFFILQYPTAAFKAFFSFRSFVTYHGIFMTPDYGSGKESVWSTSSKIAQDFAASAY